MLNEVEFKTMTKTILELLKRLEPLEAEKTFLWQTNEEILQ